MWERGVFRMAKEPGKNKRVEQRTVGFKKVMTLSKGKKNEKKPQPSSGSQVGITTPIGGGKELVPKCKPSDRKGRD